MYPAHKVGLAVKFIPEDVLRTVGRRTINRIILMNGLCPLNAITLGRLSFRASADQGWQTLTLSRAINVFRKQMAEKGKPQQ